MSYQRRGTGGFAPRRKKPIRRTASTQKNIAYLMRTNPEIRSERDAKLFLNRLQRERSQESIRITKEGRIFCVSQDGKMITDIGKDGKVIRTYPKTSFLAKEILAQYTISSEGDVRPRKPGTSRIPVRGGVKPRETDALKENISHLIGANPKIKTEKDAKLFLNKLKRYHSTESIHVTKKGRIYRESEDGTITDMGKDGKTVNILPATSEAAKKARALFPHYTRSIDRERASALRPKKPTSSRA